ncbi:uncharacterized protein LOC117180066 [Belonocnema kinseyi]|uniref:uncharacterized protein LOC117180066 n=1 Tax=Belonocnema kinseyi TaxID=2817044 RepID=UPI00143CE950|nr:uncharacterized protein LOC117180066 [Belonocnema kinseyi]
MKSIIPTTLSFFWTHVLMVLVFFRQAECGCTSYDVLPHILPTYCCYDLEEAVYDVCGEDNYYVDWYSSVAQDCCTIGCSDWTLALFCIDPIVLPPLPRYCCFDFEIVVAQVCGEDNYEIDPYSAPVRECCNQGCNDWALTQFCLSPVVYPEPILPTYCCDDLEEKVIEVCGQDNYYLIDAYSAEAQYCCYIGCDDDELSQFCIYADDMFDPASTTSLTSTSSENYMEETDPSLMSADSEELMETTDQSPTKTTTSSLLSTESANTLKTTEPTPTTP